MLNPSSAGASPDVILARRAAAAIRRRSMNAHTSVRKVIHLPARVTLDLSKIAWALRLFLAAATFAPIAHAQVPATPAPGRPLNIILVLRDQTRSELPAAAGYHTPALDRLAQQGVTFRNHYIASAMCTPSRAALYSGQPPQVNGVFDQLEAGYVPSLRKDRPNMGSMMKKLGYRTAFYGKWEMDFDILPPKSTVNYSDALQPYGFDVYQPDGDKTGTPDQGYKTDVYTAAESVRWLRGTLPELRQSGQPFFMVVSFVNPHDIMYADANVPGTPKVQNAVINNVLTAPPKNSLYSKRWNTVPSPTIQEALSAPGMPAALTDYHIGWSGALGSIPVNRPDMWRVFNDYYLNMIRDTDTSLQQLLDGLDELNLWENTVVIFTADHGEMAGDHGGLRGKGPFAYEGNAHVPLTIVHPNYSRGQSSAVLTSHLDLMPTLPGLAGVPEAERREAVKDLPGRDFFTRPRKCRNRHPASGAPRCPVQLCRSLDHRFGLLPRRDDAAAPGKSHAAPDRTATQTRQTRIPQFCFRWAIQVRTLLCPRQLQYAGYARANSSQQRPPALRPKERPARGAQFSPRS